MRVILPLEPVSRSSWVGGVGAGGVASPFSTAKAAAFSAASSMAFIRLPP